jgi:GNAT superfamily N-acetyltransferase
MPRDPAPVTQEAAALNLVTHMTWVQARLPGGHVEIGDPLVLSDSGLPSDTFNFVARARLDTGMESAIGRAAGYFAAAGRPFSWWVGPGDRPATLDRALLAAGFAAAEAEVAMAADLASLPSEGAVPGGLRIERATTDAGIRDFARVAAANWSPPDAHVLRFYRMAAPLLRRRDCPIRLYVGYLGEEPVATAELTVSEGAVGLYNIATLEAHRRKGFGTALTLRPLLDAREEGCALAVLQASAQGERVYARLGFRETGRYTEYQLPRG